MRLLRKWRAPIGWLVIIASLLVLGWLVTPFAKAYLRYYLDVPTKITGVAKIETVDDEEEARPAGPRLVINKLSINAPLVIDVNTASMAEYNAALDHGIAHMKGTAGIEAETGNTVLFGHSSRVPSTGGEFDTILATLPQLQVDDELSLVTTSNETINFVVTESKVIGPDDTSVIQSTADRRVTIITCWPLGTNLKRWVVIAEASQ